MAEQSFVVYSRIHALRKILPDLQTNVFRFRPLQPVEFSLHVPLHESKEAPDMTILGGEDGEWCLYVQGVVNYVDGRIRFPCILRSIGPVVIETPARITWEITLESQRVTQQVGTKTRFISVPLEGHESQSDDFLEIRLCDLKQALITDNQIQCRWKVSLDWVCTDTIVDAGKKSVLALHLIADAMETFEEKYTMLEQQHEPL